MATKRDKYLEAEAETLRARIAELEQVAAQAGAAAQASPEPQVRELSERVEALTRQLEAARGRDDLLTAQTVHDEGVLADLRARIGELDVVATRVQELERAVETSREETLVHERRVAEVTTELESELQGERERLTTEIGELGVRLAGAEERAEQLGTQHATLTTQLKELQDATEVTILERDGARAELVRLLEKEEEQTARISELEHLAEKNETERLASAADLDTARETARTLEAARAEAEHILSESAARLQALEDELSATTQHKAELEGVAASATEALTEAQGRVDELDAGLQEAAMLAEERAAALAEAERRAQEIAAEQEAAVARISEMETTIGALDADVTAQHERASAFEAAAAEAAAGQELAARELEAARSDAESAGADRDRFQEELGTARADLEAFRAAEKARVAQLEEERVRQTEELRDAARLRSESEGTRIAAAEAQHAEALATIAELELRLDAARATEAEAATATEAVAEERERLREELASVRDELASAQVELEASREAATTQVGLSEAAASAEDTDEGSDEAGLRAEIVNLESRLEQTEMRARRAYAAAEAAEAAMQYAKEKGELIVPVAGSETEEEMAGLRDQVAELTEKLRAVEDRAVRDEDEPQAPDAPEDDVQRDDDPLTSVGQRQKSSDSSDVNHWR